MADDPSEPALSDSGCTGQVLVRQQDGELSTAVEAAQDFMAASRSKATLRAYKSDWHDFEKWCDRHCLIMLPADARTVAAYLSAMATGQPAKLATIVVSHRTRGESLQGADIAAHRLTHDQAALCCSRT